MIIAGAINIFCNALSMLFMSGSYEFSYPDVDGQQMTLKISANHMMTFAIFKIITGALTLWQGRAIHKVFKPILKEYRDAERGITHGIAMNIRRSKIMELLKKKIWKITGLMCGMILITTIYYSNFQGEIIDQYIDQKYEYIAQNNQTENKSYSVEKMRNELYNETWDLPQKPDDMDEDSEPLPQKPEEKKEAVKPPIDQPIGDDGHRKPSLNKEQDKDVKLEAPTEEKIHEAVEQEFTGKPLIPDSPRNDQRE